MTGICRYIFNDLIVLSLLLNVPTVAWRVT
jgi:hypothetical protein